MALNTAGLNAWLDRYRAAWERRDADAASLLFTEDALYHETPFAEPKRGRAGVRAYWAGVTADQRDVRFSFETISAAGDTGVAHWHAGFQVASNGAAVVLDGVFVLRFDAAGLCSSLREWWHVRP